MCKYANYLQGLIVEIYSLNMFFIVPQIISVYESLTGFLWLYYWWLTQLINYDT